MSLGFDGYQMAKDVAGWIRSHRLKSFSIEEYYEKVDQFTAKHGQPRLGNLEKDILLEDIASKNSDINLVRGPDNLPKSIFLGDVGHQILKQKISKVRGVRQL
jgi:hypothetical protein